MSHTFIVCRSCQTAKSSYLEELISQAVFTKTIYLRNSSATSNLPLFRTISLKIFLISVRIQNFEKINPKIEDHRLKASGNGKESHHLIDSSRNIYSFENTHLAVISTNRGQPIIIQLENLHAGPKFSLFTSSQPKAVHPFLPDQLKIETFAIKKEPTEGAELSNDQINFLRTQFPEVILYLFLIIRIYDSILKKGQYLNESVCMKVIANFLNDPLMKCMSHPRLAQGMLALSHLLEVIKKDSAIRRRLEEIGAMVTYTPQMTEENKKVKEKVGVVVLSNKPKQKVIRVLDQELKVLQENGNLSHESILRCDRIFQRVPSLREHHSPLYDESIHRYLTVDLIELVKLDNTAIAKYAKSEDTGILRDSAAALGRVIAIRAKSKNTSDEVKGHLTTNAWIDSDQDRLISFSEDEPKFDPVGILHEMSQQIESVMRSFCMIATEIFQREQIEFSELGSQSLNSTVSGSTQHLDASFEKWVHVRKSSPEAWEAIVSWISSKKIGSKETIERFLDNTMVALTPEPEIEKTDEKIRNKPEILLPEEEKLIDLEFDQRTPLLINVKNESSPQNRASYEDEILKPYINPEKFNQNQPKLPEEHKGKRRRRTIPTNSMKERSKITPNPSVSCPIRLKETETTNYHSIENLKSAHQSGRYSEGSWTFWLSESGSEIIGSSSGKLARAKLVIYDQELKQVIPIFLEKTQFSSLCLWNSAVYLYFDVKLSNRFESAAKKSYQHCLFYSDLIEAFGNSGKTKGIVMLAPVLRNPENLTSRSIVADDLGIYLIGGTHIARNSTKNPLAPSNKCSFYTLAMLNEIGTENISSPIDTMQLKRSSLAITQTSKYIFVGNPTNWNESRRKPTSKLTLEIFDKEELAWLPKIFEIDIFNPELSSYISLSSLNPHDNGSQEGERLYILSSTNSTPAQVSICSVTNDENRELILMAKTKGALYEENKDFPLSKGNENFPLMHNYISDEDQLLSANIFREPKFYKFYIQFPSLPDS